MATIPGASASSQPSSRQALSEIPDEILLLIIQRLPPGDSICLALTSHKFYDLVQTVTGKEKLDLITRNEKEMKSRLSKLLSMLADATEAHQETMQRLVFWVPGHYTLCYMKHKFVNRGKTGVACSRCKERREAMQKFIEQL